MSTELLLILLGGILLFSKKSHPLDDEEIDRLQNKYKRLEKWVPWVWLASKNFKVNTSIIISIMWQESRGVLFVEDGFSGDAGIMQITQLIYEKVCGNTYVEITGMKHIVQTEERAFENGKRSINCASKFLNELKGKLKNWNDVIVGYNVGEDLNPYNFEYLNSVRDHEIEIIKWWNVTTERKLLSF